jgi:hypothetical protein
MAKQRASDKKRSSKSGKKRKERAVEYEDVVLYSKQLGRRTTRSVPVSPSPSPKKNRIAGPSGLKSQLTRDYGASSSSAEPMADIFSDDPMSMMGWLPDEEDIDSSSKYRKQKSGKVRTLFKVINKLLI